MNYETYREEVKNIDAYSLSSIELLDRIFAKEFCEENEYVTVVGLQRAARWGYNRAIRLIEFLETQGFCSKKATGIGRKSLTYKAH